MPDDIMSGAMALYRLIIVDDEESTRSGLSEFVKWPELGFTLEGAFSDGRSALAWLERHRADVVLTDIRMPDITGIDLAERIRGSWPATRVVLISGHKEFDYARRAIEYGVKHYLLKPTRLHEVRTTFQRLYSELDAERAASSSVYHGSQRYQEALPYLRDQFFWDITTGNLTHEADLRRRAALIDLPFDPLDSPCALATVEVAPDPFEGLGDTHARSSALVRAAGGRIDVRRCFVTASWSRRYTVVAVGMPDATEAVAMGEASEAAKALAEALRSSAECTAFCSPVQGYRSLLDMALQGPSVTIRQPDAEPEPGGAGSDRAMADLYRSVVRELHHGNLEHGLEALDALVRGLDMSARTASVRYVIGALAAADARIAEICGEGSGLGDVPYRELVKAENNRQLCARVIPVLDRLKRCRAEQSTIAARDAARAASDYIEHHFSSELTLQNLAEHLHLNPSYLSRLFHKEIGVTFTDYLVDRRMRHAADLLAEGTVSIREVARRTGYADPKYFSRVFRKQFGQTPKEYARRRWYGTNRR